MSMSEAKKIKNCLLKCVYVLKLFASASDSTPAMSKCFCHHHKKQKFALIHLMISCLRWTCHPLLNPHFLFQLLMKVCILMDKYKISKYGFKFSCVESKWSHSLFYARLKNYKSRESHCSN